MIAPELPEPARARTAAWHSDNTEAKVDRAEEASASAAAAELWFASRAEMHEAKLIAP